MPVSMDPGNPSVKTNQETTSLRHQLATNGRLRLEFIAGVSQLMRAHNVPITDNVLRKLTLATENEVAPSP